MTHLIWDWNGTLLNDTSWCVHVLNGMLEEESLPLISESIYRQHFGFPVIDFYRWLGFDSSEENYQKLSHRFINAYESGWLERCLLHRSVDSILIKLSEHGMTHSVLSAAKQDALETGIPYFGIRSHFIELIGADNIYARGKVEQGRQWIEQLPYDPEQTVLIGDTLHDFEVAEAMGIGCILLAHGHQSRERLETSGAVVLESLDELVDLFIES